jgi:hypothetical protein
MATRNFNANKSSLFAKTGSTELGGGQDNHLPVGGSWNGYTFRSAVRFATDWSGMKNIQSAVLWLKTSSAVHLAFSSDPDIYIARCSADWTANSAASSGESGGSGWSTAATNYPGPGVTTSGQVSKDVSTAEQTWISVDISTIVRAWAPAAVAGGGGAPNYGVLLYGVASGDLTEFNSYQSSTPPYIVVTYATDTAPEATVTGPTGVQATTTPTVTATATDVDGDPITAYWVRVWQGATLVHENKAAGSGPSLAYVTPALPGGALAVDVAAQAGGLWSAWTAQLPFTVDRPPTAPTWTAPVGNVSSNRRPVHTFAATDPDGDALEVWDLEVYQSSGGAPLGGAVYAVSGQSSGITGMSVSHTPTADLPGGPLLARSRVRTGPADLWSPWSAYQAYSIILTTPTVAWIWPATDGGYLPPVAYTDPAMSLLAILYQAQVDARPPSGQTLTNLKIEWRYTGGAYTTITNTTPAGAGGIFSANKLADANGAAPYGSGGVRYTLTASGGGITVVERTWKAAALEVVEAVSLGDQVSALTAALAATAGGDSVGWIRAQSSAIAANGAAPWRTLAQVATALAELPAAGAWVGLRARFVQRAADADLLGGSGSFEDPAMPGWVGAQGVSIGFVGAPDGARLLRITGNGVANYPGKTSPAIPVVPGATYTLRATAKRAAGTVNAVVRADFQTDTGANAGSGSVINRFTTGGFVTLSATFQAPATGVATMKALCFVEATAAAATEAWDFDAVTLVGPAAGVGLDRWDLAWTSLG